MTTAQAIFRPLLAGFVMMGSSAIAAAPPAMEDIQGEAVTAAGTQTELASRATACASSTLRFDAVTLQDSGSEALFGGKGVASQVIPGGDIIIHSDANAGVVIANSRVPFKILSLNSIVQSKITIETKDGRFRIRHSDIRTAFLDTGYSANDGFTTVRPTGKPAKQTAEKLSEVSQKLATCIGSTAAEW